jgi:hypothetical protein
LFLSLHKHQKRQVGSIFQIAALLSLPDNHQQANKSISPLEVTFFVWMGAFGKILTLEIGVVCAKRVGNPLITFFFIVKWQEKYGVCFSIYLVLSGLCLEEGKRIVGELERSSGKL